MTSATDVIIIGGGADALVAATVLARAGRRVVLLAREGNAAGTNGLIEVASGFLAPVALEAEWIPPAVLQALGRPPIAFDAPWVPASVALPGGGTLALPRAPGEATAAIGAHSPRDAKRWSDFLTAMRRLAGFLETMDQMPAPDIDTSSIGDLPGLLSLGRAYRALGKADMSELLRVLPMSVKDLVDEWFTSESLKAAVTAAAVREIRQGPRSGGTSFVLLHHMVGAEAGTLRGRGWPNVSGEPNSLIAWIEAEAVRAGVTIRTRKDVAQVLVRDDAVTGVVLVGGEEIAATTVLSTLDARRTFLDLVDPVWLDPEFLLAVRNIKFRGSTALVNFALSALPPTAGIADAERALAGVVSLSPTVDDIERAFDAAKYGRIPAAPHIEFSVPSLRWPGLTPERKHVLTARAHFVPHTLREGSWDAGRSAIADTVAAAIERVMPGFANVVTNRSVLTPVDLESRFGMSEGALTHGEMTLDQILFMRPVAGWGRYETPIRGLFVAGPGTHPGPGVFGMSGLLAARRLQSGPKR